jgi:hypothetical protein
MVSLNGVIGVFETNAHIIQMYSPTWTKAYAQHNHADGSGVGFGVDFKRLREVKVNVLFVCSSYYVF